MRKVSLHVETLACEADEEYVVEEILAQDGVLAAEVDLEREQIEVAYDEQVTNRASVEQFLRFFGLVPKVARS
ncbi:MAG TPA: hypothetical protein VNZ52_06625 [Candidatus Thermoplasmatota archaeon]|nr:hypothetical protein [Candidatus Thermoplasmatota archaeon]